MVFTGNHLLGSPALRIRLHRNIFVGLHHKKLESRQSDGERYDRYNYFTILFKLKTVAFHLLINKRIPHTRICCVRSSDGLYSKITILVELKIVAFGLSLEFKHIWLPYLKKIIFTSASRGLFVKNIVKNIKYRLTMN